MSTRKEILEESQELETEISYLKEFMEMLEYELTKHSAVRFSKPFVQREVKFNFFGIWNSSRKINMRIPDKMIIEINVLCITWLTELEQRADNLLKGN